MQILRSLTMALVFLLAAPVAQANLVLNGDFEASPDHTLNWTYDDPDGLQLFATDFTDPVSTNYVFHDGSYTSMGHLSQSIATTIGATYTLSFDVLRGHDSTLGTLDNRFITSFGGITLIDESDIVAGWTHLSFNVTATALTSILEFSNLNVTSYNQLDNISLLLQDPGGPTDPVPEPATLVLLAGGLVALSISRRRKAHL